MAAQPPWMPEGYHEEERTCYPLMVWSATYLWWTIRLIGRLDPEWAHVLSVFVLAHWPRFRYHVLVKD
jgi:hypothetical protein